MILFVLALAALPDDANELASQYEATVADIRAKAEAQITPHRERAIAALQALQDKYTRMARLDEAVAIRDKIRQLSGVRDDPGALHVTEEDIGKTMVFLVTGATQPGAVWGTDVYTSDSHLGSVAVHAGVLKAGQKGIVRVKVRPGQSEYKASTKNGVTSMPYGAWGVSFSVSGDLQVAK
jgi:hypothetical protein